MTPEDAWMRPELFLHDACLPSELRKAFKLDDHIERGWVIERGEASDLEYLTVDRRCFAWSREHPMAIRFARSEDAALLTNHFLLTHMFTKTARVTEHEWSI